MSMPHPPPQDIGSDWIQEILATATEAVISVDDQQRIILFNQAAEEIFQYEAEEVVGRPLTVLIPERFHERHAGDVDRFASGGERPRRMAAGRTVKGRRKNGAEFPAEASISRVVDQGRTILTVILRDVSEREAAVRRLADSEARFRTLVDKFPGFVYTMEMGAAEDGKAPAPVVTYASSRSITIVGREPESLYGPVKTWLEIVDPEMRQQVLEAHLRCLEEGKAIDQTARLIDDEGETRTVLNRATRSMVFNSETRREYAVLQGVMIDVTERERLQQKLVQSERMAEAGRLAAIVAHEIHSPITAIRGCFEVLLARADLGEDLREYTETAYEEAKRVGTLAMQLRDYSRPAHETRRPLQLNDLIADISNMIGHELLKHGITISKQLDRSLPPVFGDAHELKQVVWNLVANAWDAMPEGGHVELRTRAEGAGPKQSVILEIEDTGKGISPGIRSKIFNMFFTTKENTHSGGGAGLGLAITQKIIDRHEGRIEFDSEVGQGTTFRVVLPAIQEQDV